VTAAKRTAAGELGTLRLGYNWSARFDTLPALGRALTGHRPDVELVTEEMRTYLMPAALRMGTIDVALAVYPDIVAELSYRTVRRELIVAVLSDRSSGHSSSCRRGSLRRTAGKPGPSGRGNRRLSARSIGSSGRSVRAFLDRWRGWIDGSSSRISSRIVIV
jgi:hypothetical protein